MNYFWIPSWKSTFKVIDQHEVLSYHSFPTAPRLSYTGSGLHLCHTIMRQKIQIDCYHQKNSLVWSNANDIFTFPINVAKLYQLLEGVPRTLRLGNAMPLSPTQKRSKHCLSTTKKLPSIVRHLYQTQRAARQALQCYGDWLVVFRRILFESFKTRNPRQYRPQPVLLPNIITFRPKTLPFTKEEYIIPPLKHLHTPLSSQSTLSPSV